MTELILRNVLFYVQEGLRIDFTRLKNFLIRSENDMVLKAIAAL